MTHIVTTRYGTMECLGGDSVVSRSLIRYGEWAEDELTLLAHFVRPGMTVMDVGAFLGTHTLALASMVGAQGTVHSFEPRAGIRAILERNIQRNELTQVRLHNCALGAAVAQLEVPAIDIESEANFGGLAIEALDGDTAEPTETITIERLDDLGITRVDVIKLDAEGMEADVLAGAALTIAGSRPVLLAECNDLERGSRTLRAYFDLGYSVYGVLSPAYNPANLRAEGENIFGDGAEVSLLAIPGEQQMALIDPTLQARLAAIHTLDDLALLLLHKAQYPAEVLAQCTAASVLGMDYLSPLARRQRELISELEAAARSAIDRAQEAERRESRATRGAAATQAAVESLQRTLANPARHNPGSWLHWARRLQRLLGIGS
jgi:FkbM family methyltransferase